MMIYSGMSYISPDSVFRGIYSFPSNCAGDIAAHFPAM